MTATLETPTRWATMDARFERDELLARLDLAAMFTDAGFPKGTNKQYPCPNPIHSQTGKTPPVTIGQEDGHDLWHCKGCGAGGSAVDFVMYAKGATEAEAFAALRRIAGLPELARSYPRPVAPVGPVLDPEADRIEGGEAEHLLGAYLDARKWSTETVDVFGLFVVEHSGAMWVRHPYREGGETLWWQDRHCSGRPGPKWWNPPGAKRQLYGHDLATIREWSQTYGRLFVVEGPADTIAMFHASDGASVVGIPGTEGAHRWARMLTGLDVYLLLDADEAGDKAAAALARIVHDGGGRSVRVRPPDGLDVDDWRRQVGDDALAGAVVDVVEAMDWWTPDQKGGRSWG